jgi:lactate dehydrogenase-like 2-hydroxyacid dehydrogenase
VGVRAERQEDPRDVSTPRQAASSILEVVTDAETKASSTPNRKGHAMKITTIGRGSIGGTLARLWTAAGHEVTTLGRRGR